MILDINQKDYQIPKEMENKTLLYVLRDYLHLTGTKKGCGSNDCGACRVLIDDEAVNSCVVLARAAEGKKIETIEGLSDGIHPNVIQQAFIDEGAVQCGFCTPGMIISATALLRKNPQPSENDIRKAIHPNLCRCTGYVKIVKAIQLAASRMA